MKITEFLLSKYDLPMDDFITYTTEHVPVATGQINCGSICWFNTLMQALWANPSIAEALSRNKHERSYTGNKLARAYLERLQGPLSENTSIELLSLFQAKLRLDKVAHVFDNGQDCVTSALHQFIEKLGRYAFSLFRNVYIRKIICPACGDVNVSPRDRSVVIGVEDEAIPFKTQEDFCGYLHQHETLVDCYRCDKCQRISHNLIREETLVAVAEIIVIAFGKYHVRGERWFPEYLEFPKKGDDDDVIRYRLVAKVDHSGTYDGGHYWAHALLKGADGDLQWHKMNDIGVSAGNPEPSSDTVIVFYHML